MKVRTPLVVLHRYVGLATAGFLVLAGLTGSLIAFQPELDAWLNPHLFRVVPTHQTLSLQRLAAAVEAADPHVRATFITPAAAPGDSALVTVEPRTDTATKEPFRASYNQVFVDPASGAILGTRLYGAWRFDTAHFMPFVMVLHYSLHIPDRWGDWLLGAVAIAWMLDCFIGFWLTLPARSKSQNAGKPWWRRWQAAWQVKRGASVSRINFDLHRAGGLWLWVLLFVMALTSIAMNLNREVFRPVVERFGAVTPNPFAALPRFEPPHANPKLDWDEAVAMARASLAEPMRSWPVRGVFHASESNAYAVTLTEQGGRNTALRLGSEQVFVNADTGQRLATVSYGSGTAADKFLAWQYPLHSGQIAGLPGRILICVAGLAVAALAVTGLVVWGSKRRGRRSLVAVSTMSTGPIDRLQARP
jgi:uncharacterized iron-regulated membrane protein